MTRHLATLSERRWWQRWSVRLGVVVLVALAGYLYLIELPNLRVRAALARLDREDPGWRFDDIVAARPEVPADANSARVVVATVDLLPARWPAFELEHAFSDVPPEQRLRAADFGQVCNELGELDAALAEARKLADLPRGRYALGHPSLNDYPPAWHNDLQKGRAVVRLLHLDTLRRADEGDGAVALADCRAMVNVARSVGDEPTGMAVMLRAVYATVACNAAERVLAQGEPPPAELSALQQALEGEDANSDLWQALRGERAILNDVATAIESGQMPPPGRLSLSEWDFPPDLSGPFLRNQCRKEHPVLLSFLTRFVEASRLPPGADRRAEKAIEAEIGALEQSAILVWRLAPGLARVANAHRYKQAHVRSQIACLAAERYRRAHGRWPNSLADLVPTELSAVPVDPFDGQPLRFRRSAEGVVIYSVGMDGKDDGGTLYDGPRSIEPGADLGCRLWDVNRRGQPPPATSGRAP
jgi:hypothetical protein